VLILPYLEWQALYDFVSVKSDSFYALTGPNLWNNLQENEQKQLHSPAVLLTRTLSVKQPEQMDIKIMVLKVTMPSLSDGGILTGLNGYKSRKSMIRIIPLITVQLWEVSMVLIFLKITSMYLDPSYSVVFFVPLFGKISMIREHGHRGILWLGLRWHFQSIPCWRKEYL
jgi:hypothetical protein